MAFTVPNVSAAGFADQAKLDSGDLEHILAPGVSLTGVQDGCAVTAQGTPDMTVAVAAGTVRRGGRKVTVAGGNVTITAADGGDPRFDLITVDVSGTLAAVAGTPAGNPELPDPSGDVVLAAVYVPAADTAIESNQINDRRVDVDEPPHENVKWYGAVGDGVADDTAAIQAADTAAAGSRAVFFPDGVYGLASTVTISSGVSYVGTGPKSVLKIIDASTYNLLETAAAVTDVLIHKLAFDGSLNYPAGDPAQDAGTFPLNAAIQIKDDASSNIHVKDCYFAEMSYGSVKIEGLDITDVSVVGCYMRKGAYRHWPIRVESSVGFTEANQIRRVVVRGNHLDENGPQVWADPSNPSYIGSSDGIKLDGVRDAIVTHNTVHKSSSIGIRVEDSDRVIVKGNVVTEPGATGIQFYVSEDCVCSNNTILNWGRIPAAHAIRDHAGTQVVAREFPVNPGAVLPADPTASSWFDTWPYSVEGITVGNIITYDDTDYYTTGPGGILPFRGDSAIAVVQNSKRITVIGNTGVGSAAVDGAGDLLYSSDFGLSVVHPTNDVTNPGADCTVVGNVFTNCHQFEVYHPANHDPINGRGATGQAWYGATDLSASQVDNKAINTEQHDVTGSIIPDVNKAYTIGANASRFAILYLASWIEMEEHPGPSAPPSANARIYVRDDGGGKTQLVVRFPTGANQILATEP